MYLKQILGILGSSVKELPRVQTGTRRIKILIKLGVSSFLKL